jgi:hypothetical protein
MQTAVVLWLLASCGPQDGGGDSDRIRLREVFRRFVEVQLDEDEKAHRAMLHKGQFGNLDAQGRRYVEFVMRASFRNFQALRGGYNLEGLAPKTRVLAKGGTAFAREMARTIGPETDIVQIGYTLRPGQDLILRENIFLVEEDGELRLVTFLPPKEIIGCILEEKSSKEIQKAFPDESRRMEAVLAEVNELAWSGELGD